MTGPKIIWEDEALQILERRDRYARNAVREEFREEPKKNAVEYDTDQHVFVTPVVDQRFGVVWREDGLSAIVQAVVPLTIDLHSGDFSSEEGRKQLKEYLERAMSAAVAKR